MAGKWTKEKDPEILKSEIRSGMVSCGSNAACEARRLTPEEEEVDDTFQDGDRATWRRERQIGLHVSHGLAVVQPQWLLHQARCGIPRSLEYQLGCQEPKHRNRSKNVGSLSSANNSDPSLLHVTFIDKRLVSVSFTPPLIRRGQQQCEGAA